MLNLCVLPVIALVLSRQFKVLAALNAHQQSPPANLGPTWLEKYGRQSDQSFSGPLSFAHLPYIRCLEDGAARFDIAILGIPFDTAVSYRTGCD